MWTIATNSKGNKIERGGGEKEENKNFHAYFMMWRMFTLYRYINIMYKCMNLNQRKARFWYEHKSLTIF